MLRKIAVSINTARMEMVGFEPTSAGYPADTAPLSYIPRIQLDTEMLEKETIYALASLAGFWTGGSHMAIKCLMFSSS